MSADNQSNIFRQVRVIDLPGGITGFCIREIQALSWLTMERDVAIVTTLEQANKWLAGKENKS